MEGFVFGQFAAEQESTTGSFEHVNLKSSFVICGKILKYLRKCNLLQDDTDTL
jgi:hypothetical protein